MWNTIAMHRFTGNNVRFPRAVLTELCNDKANVRQFQHVVDLITNEIGLVDNDAHFIENYTQRRVSKFSVRVRKNALFGKRKRWNDYETHTIEYDAVCDVYRLTHDAKLFKKTNYFRI